MVSALNWLRLGTPLSTRHDMPPIGHGKFDEWLASWFPLSENTARKWMRIAAKYHDKATVTVGLGTEALGALCSTSTSEPVRHEIERRAVDGGNTSVAEIARLKAEHKAEAERLMREIDAATAELAKQRAVPTTKFEKCVLDKWWLCSPSTEYGTDWRALQKKQKIQSLKYAHWRRERHRR